MVSEPAPSPDHPVTTEEPHQAQPRIAVRAPDERYEVAEEISRGGMGRIRVARDRKLERVVAVKELLQDSAVARARFDREAKITARLQHPAIIPIYDATLGEAGAPSYSMRLVAGRSLDALIDAAATLDARLALLPNVIAVADAMAYAHSQLIIHRDLKPANVLVGDFGETVVIDWGLAKDLTLGDDELAWDGATGQQSPGLTAAGTVLGTPVYMAPEQALGAAVDERADVYALGAMLYHLLAAAPPGAGFTETLPAGTAPVAQGSLPRGVPRDLAAIVRKAMAHAPPARYPSARELAADLRRFQTGQLVSAHRYSPGMRIRRFVRKHRAAVAAGALLIAGLGIGGAISVRRIQAERDIADTRLVAAEDLMDFVVSDLRGRLKPLGKLELLEGVGDRVDRYYQTIDANDQLGGEAGRQELARRIEARELVGDVKFAKGDTDGALAVHRERLALAHRLGNHELIASSENSIGDVLDARGDTAGAFAAFQRALPEAIASGDPRRLGTVQMRLGGAYQEQGDLDRAVALFTAALASHERAMAAAPGDVDRQVNVAMASGRLADILEVRGEVAGALARFRAGRDRLLPVVAAHPDDVNAMRALSIFHSRIGDALHDQGDLNGALAALRQSQTLGLALAAREPFNQEWQRDIGVDHSTISHMLREQGDRKAAAAELRESHAVTDRLLAADPTSATYQRDLVDTLMDEGDLCDDPACAVARFQQALDAARALEARDPSNADVSGRRLRAQLQLAAQLHERSDPSELGAARDALAQAIAWVHATPARPEGALLVGYGKILVAQSAARTPAGKPEARALAAEALAVLRATPPTSLRSEFRGGVAEILALAAVLAGEPQPASTRIPNRRDIR